MDDATDLTMKTDAEGFRRGKTVGAVVTKFLYDLGQAQTPGLAPVVAEYNGCGVLQAKYHSGAVGLLGMRRSSTTYWYLCDALGSVRKLANTSGTVTDSYLQDAWGNLITSSGSTVNPFRYVGRENYYSDPDDLLDLVLLGVRYYNPALGRFITPDPIGLAGGDYNLYRYVRSSPLNGADPSGLWPYEDEIRRLVAKIRSYSDQSVSNKARMTDIVALFDAFIALVRWTTPFEHSYINLYRFRSVVGGELVYRNDIGSSWAVDSPEAISLKDRFVKTWRKEINCVVGASGTLSLQKTSSRFPGGGPWTDFYGWDRKFAIGLFDFQGTAKYRVEKPLLGGCRAIISAHYILSDYYNWDPGQSLIFPRFLKGVVIPKDWFNDMTKTSPPAGANFWQYYIQDEEIPVPCKK